MSTSISCKRVSGFRVSRFRLVTFIIALSVVVVSMLATTPEARLGPPSDPTTSGRRRLEAVDFDVGISLLKKYKAEHGDLTLPQATVMTVEGKEIHLGKWVQRLRQLHKNTYVTPKARPNFGQMTDAQKKQLDDLGFMFELPEEMQGQEKLEFDDGFTALKAYKVEHGDLFVPQSAVVKSPAGKELKLGKWVQRLRQLHKNTYVTPKARKGFGQMTDEQLKLLEGIEFPFDLPEELKGPPPIEWDAAYEQLVIYQQKNKNCLVPQATVVTHMDGSEIKLGKWIQRQRQVYKNTYVTPGARKSFGKLTDEQKEKLEAIGFDFEVPEELKGPPPVDWDEAFAELSKYFKEHGDTKVPEKTTFGAKQQDLGKWCQRQRQIFKNTYITPKARKNFGQMSQEQRDKLTSIKFDFPEA